MPQVVVGLVAGVFVDRWDRRRTMVVANLLLAVGLLPLVLLDVADRIWVVYVVLAWEAVVEVFFAPAEQAMLPRVVAGPEGTDEADLVTANALNGQIQQLSRLVGGALGGVAAAVGGITAVALLDAVTFVVATGLLLRIRTTGGCGGDEPDGFDKPTTWSRQARQPGALTNVRTRCGGGCAQLGSEWAEGLRASWGHPAVRVLLVFALITATGEGIMGTLFAPYVRDVLHSGPARLGVITSVQAVGGIVGGFVVAGLGERLSPVLMLGAGSVVFGLVDLAIFLYPLLLDSAWPAAVGMVVVGVPGALVMAGLMTLLQRYTLDAQRGRVFSLLFVARSVAMVVGTTAPASWARRSGSSRCWPSRASATSSPARWCSGSSRRCGTGRTVRSPRDRTSTRPSPVSAPSSPPAAAPARSSCCPTRCTPPRWPPRRSAARSARSPTACSSTPTARRC